MRKRYSMILGLLPAMVSVAMFFGTGTAFAADGPNLVPNPGFENGQGAWISGGWGTNSCTLAVNPASAHTGSLGGSVNCTSYTDGDAKWDFPSQPVTPGETYNYSLWFKSSPGAKLELDSHFCLNAACTSDTWDAVKTVTAATGWTQVTGNDTAPAGAVSGDFALIMSSTGTLQSDDYSMVDHAVPALTQGMVSVNLDDGWAVQYKNAYPVLKADGLLGGTTNFIISGSIGQSGYMGKAKIKAFQTGGAEIGGHTVTHPDAGLPSEPAGSCTQKGSYIWELCQSKKTLQADFGPNAALDFASPDGIMNDAVLAQVKNYYLSHRGVASGCNTTGNFDVWGIRAYSVDINTPPATVDALIDQAASQHCWMILLYHGVGGNPGGDIWYTSNTQFTSEMNYLHSKVASGAVAAVTNRQGIVKMQSTLGQ